MFANSIIILNGSFSILRGPNIGLFIMMTKYMTMATKALYSDRKIMEIRSGLYTEKRIEATIYPNVAI